jgi:ABC-type uncharacterized transport system auxiliary subunit
MPWNWSIKVIMNSSNKDRVFCILAIAFVLTGCSGLTRSDRPAVTTWWLQPYGGATPMAVTDSSVAVDLNVTVVPGLDSDQILALSADAELKPYAGARWAEHLPELFDSLIGRSLQASGRFDIRSGRSGRDSGSCDLQLELREFFAELGATGRTTGVRAALSGRYQCGSAAPVHVRSHVSISVADERMNIIVAAFQQATDQMTRDILDQL